MSNDRRENHMHGNPEMHGEHQGRSGLSDWGHPEQQRTPQGNSYDQGAARQFGNDAAFLNQGSDHMDQRPQGAGQQGFDQQRYGQQGLGSYGGPDHHDHEYRNWRDQQMQAFDREYHEFRQHRQERFNSDFEEWRKNRNNGGETR